jgi:hypothetical protein
MNERIKQLAEQANAHETGHAYYRGEKKPENAVTLHSVDLEKFAELILANADELKRMMNTDPINKPFELNPKFVAKCDEIGRSRRQFQ